MGRKHYRAKLSILAQCYAIGHEASLSNFSATTEDISLSGMQALFPVRVSAGISLRIEIRLRMGQVIKRVSVVGKVVRCGASRSVEISPKLFPTAIKFVLFRKGGPEVLEQFMDFIRSRSIPPSSG